MPVLHISQADAIRDFASVLAQVRAGSEVVIQDGNTTVALLRPPSIELEQTESGYDEWFQSTVQQTLSNDPAKRVSEEQAEEIMAERRRAASQDFQSSAA